MSKSLAEMKAGVSEAVRRKADARAAELRAEIAGLQPLRQALEQTQAELAEHMKISQASVAKMEQRTDLLLSTLRHYVEALGGELSLVARFPGRPEVRIAGLGEILKKRDAPGRRQVAKQRRASVS